VKDVVEPNAPGPTPTVSDAVRQMRAAARAREPVPAEQVNMWATTFMQLFTEQRPVRLEQWGGSTGYWYQIDERQWHRAVARREQVRALYLQPLPHERRSKSEKRDHVWSADRTHCVACKAPINWAEPYCEPPKPPEPVVVKRQPFNPNWFTPALDQLEVLVRKLSPDQRKDWYRQINGLRKAIQEANNETSPWTITTSR